MQNKIGNSRLSGQKSKNGSWFGITFTAYCTQLVQSTLSPHTPKLSQIILKHHLKTESFSRLMIEPFKQKDIGAQGTDQWFSCTHCIHAWDTNIENNNLQECWVKHHSKHSQKNCRICAGLYHYRVCKVITCKESSRWKEEKGDLMMQNLKEAKKLTSGVMASNGIHSLSNPWYACL